MSAIARIARRFGFEPTIAITAVDGWIGPVSGSAPMRLAPRGGAGAVLVDGAGSITIEGPDAARWSLAWTVAAGAQWAPFAMSKRIEQRLESGAVLATRIETPHGHVVQRVAAAVVDGRPAAVVEIENASGVAVAIGVAARPMALTGRGYIDTAEVDSDGVTIDGRRVMRFERPPAATACSSAAEGDLLAKMPEPTSDGSPRSVSCRSGGAQAGAVWPLAHTAIARFVVECAGPTSASAPVPAIEDIARGWSTHLGSGMAVGVDGERIAEAFAAATRELWTSAPTPELTPNHLIGLAEVGHGEDAGRVVPANAALDPAPFLLATARWFQLAPNHDLLDEFIGPVAKAAHYAATTAGRPTAPSWAAAALVSLGRGLDEIEQEGVGERVREFAPRERAEDNGSLLEGLRDADARFVWSEPGSAALFVRNARAALLADRGRRVDVLPLLPESWRGKSIEVLRAPIEGGTFSYGIRWHGPRPALLWEFDGDVSVPVEVTASGIDPTFSSTDPVGETLLADPGWAS